MRKPQNGKLPTKAKPTTSARLDARNLSKKTQKCTSAAAETPLSIQGITAVAVAADIKPLHLPFVFSFL
jgi:hypothetical protein